MIRMISLLFDFSGAWNHGRLPASARILFRVSLIGILLLPRQSFLDSLSVFEQIVSRAVGLEVYSYNSVCDETDKLRWVGLHLVPFPPEVMGVVGTFFLCLDCKFKRLVILGSSQQKNRDRFAVWSR